MNNAAQTQAPELQTDGLQLPQEGFVRLAQVLQHIPVSRSTWLNWVESRYAPDPARPSPGILVWSVKDIRALIAKIEATKAEARTRRSPKTAAPKEGASERSSRRQRKVIS